MSLSMNARRRVRSADTAEVLVDTNRSRRTPAISLVGNSRTLNPLNPEMLAQEDAGGLGIFSDEYDLCM